MIGISIFVHAVKMVLNNVGPALRIGALPVIVMVAAALMIPGATEPVAPGAAPPIPTAGGLGGGLVALAVQIMASVWVAVAWHRYILLEEQPGAFLPQWNGGAIWEYFKTSFLLGAMLILLAVPLVVVAGIVAFPSLMANEGEPGLAAGLMFFLIVALPMTWLGYRLGPVLPGAAIGQALPFGQAWRATKRGAVDLLVLALVSVVALWLPLTIVTFLPSAIEVFVHAILNWLSVMIGVGIVTTIYGHYVQGRALNA